MTDLLKSIFSNRELILGILNCGGDRQAIAKLIEAAGLSMDEEKLGQLTEFAVVWKKQQDGEELSETEAALLPDAAETELVGKLFKDAADGIDDRGIQRRVEGDFLARSGGEGGQGLALVEAHDDGAAATAR